MPRLPAAQPAAQALLEQRQRMQRTLVRVIARWLDLHLPHAKKQLGECLLHTKKQWRRAEAEAHAAEAAMQALADSEDAGVGGGAAAVPLSATEAAERGHQRRPEADGTGSGGAGAGGGGGGWATAGAPKFPVSVEALGSGVVLCPCLQVDKTMTVGEIKCLVEARHPDRRMQKQRLFKGHGGVELALNFRSLHAYKVRRGTVLVLASAAASGKKQKSKKASSSRKGPKSMKKRKNKDVRPYGRVRVGEFGGEAAMQQLRAALRTRDPSAVMERLRLRPRHVPFWTCLDLTTRIYLNELGDAWTLTAMYGTIIDYARRKSLPSLRILELWDRQLADYGAY